MSNLDQIKKKALALHKKLKGKIETGTKIKVKTAADLSLVYTPGVGAVSSYIAEHKSEVGEYTIKSNTVAVVSDGSAVLGLGGVGPEAALPVMEGKAMLFKEFGGVNAFPIVLDTQDTEEIIKTVKNIAPAFGGINLEDISAPRCFEIEERLRKMLDIPVFHDDQHGTATVVLAGLINAFKVVKKDMKKSRIVVIGAGAAGTAITKLLLEVGVKNILVIDTQGIIDKSREGMDKFKTELANITNPENIKGDLKDAMKGSDAVIGVSKAGLLKREHVTLMASKPIIFAMANPIPEILPSEITGMGVGVFATGRSDFPNQVNNSLGFPGIFKGALENKVKNITSKMQIKAAQNLAALVPNPKSYYIIPSIFDKRVVKAVSSAIK